MIVVSRLRASHVGRAWLAIRQDELAAKANGVEVVRYKLLAYMGGAVWAGIIGVIFVAKQTIVSPTSFQFSQSFYVLASVIIGGMGSVPGAIVGGFLFVLISESLQGVAQTYSSVVFSLALLAVIVLRPRGSGRRRSIRGFEERKPGRGRRQKRWTGSRETSPAARRGKSPASRRGKPQTARRGKPHAEARSSA